MAMFGGFPIRKRKEDQSDLNAALNIYNAYKINKDSRESAERLQKQRNDYNENLAKLKADLELMKTEAKYKQNKEKLASDFIKELIKNYPAMTKDEALNLFNVLNNDTEPTPIKSTISGGDAMEAISKGKSKKEQDTLDYSAWVEGKLKKLKKVPTNGNESGPYMFVDEEGNEVKVSQKAYDFGLKNDIEDMVYVPAQGKFMSKGAAEGWAKRVANNINKTKKYDYIVGIGGIYGDGNITDNTTNTTNNAPLEGESKVAYIERMKAQRDSNKPTFEQKNTEDDRRKRVQFELNMRKVGLKKATKNEDGTYTLVASNIGDFDENTTWVKIDKDGNLTESDLTQRQIDAKKEYDEWKEETIIKPRESRKNEVIDKRLDASNQRKDEATIRKQFEAEAKEIYNNAEKYYTADNKEKLRKTTELTKEWRKLQSSWNTMPVVKGDAKWFTKPGELNRAIDSFLSEYEAARIDPLKNEAHVYAKYAQLFPGLFEKGKDYASTQEELAAWSKLENYIKGKDLTKGKNLIGLNEYLLNLGVDLSARGKTKEEYMAEVQKRIDARRALVNQKLAEIKVTPKVESIKESTPDTTPVEGQDKMQLPTETNIDAIPDIKETPRLGPVQMPGGNSFKPGEIEAELKELPPPPKKEEVPPSVNADLKPISQLWETLRAGAKAEELTDEDGDPWSDRIPLNIRLLPPAQDFEALTPKMKQLTVNIMMDLMVAASAEGMRAVDEVYIRFRKLYPGISKATINYTYKPTPKKEKTLEEKINEEW